jgi:hypothetical protein
MQINAVDHEAAAVENPCRADRLARPEPVQGEAKLPAKKVAPAAKKATAPAKTTSPAKTAAAAKQAAAKKVAPQVTITLQQLAAGSAGCVSARGPNADRLVILLS